MVSTAPDLAERLVMALQMMAHSSRAAACRGELTPTRLIALTTLKSLGPMRLGHLASRMGIQVSTMSRLADVLVASGWAERRPDDTDHRACVIGTTEAGMALLDATRHSEVTRIADCLAGLGPADLARLQAALPVLELITQRLTCPAASCGHCI